MTLYVRELKRYYVACWHCEHWASREFDTSAEAWRDAESRGFRKVKVGRKDRHVCGRCAVLLQ